MARASTPTLRTMSTISNMKATILLAVIIATAALIWPVIRRQSPERQLELAIENLASPDFDKTKDAEKRILEVGPSAVPALATSIRNSRDQDQRRLLYALIRETRCCQIRGFGVVGLDQRDRQHLHRIAADQRVPKFAHARSRGCTELAAEEHCPQSYRRSDAEVH